MAPGSPTTAYARDETLEFHYRAVERVIVAMREHLHDSYSDNLTLGQMAEVAIMSPYHFNRVFSHLTGIPPGRFLGALRLESAKRLLLATELSVTDVCFEVGYSSLGTFIRRFTELVGISPGRFRAMARREVDPGFEALGVASDRPPHRGNRRCVGTVNAPPNFHGPIFVGLFPSSIPESRPVACTVASSAGPYRFWNLPDGDYHIFAAAISTPQSTKDYYLYEFALRGGGQPVTVSGGTPDGDLDIQLRTAAVTDPPILATFPILARKYASPVSTEP